MHTSHAVPLNPARPSPHLASLRLHPLLCCLSSLYPLLLLTSSHLTSLSDFSCSFSLLTFRPLVFIFIRVQLFVSSFLIPFFSQHFLTPTPRLLSLSFPHFFFFLSSSSLFFMPTSLGPVTLLTCSFFYRFFSVLGHLFNVLHLMV